MNEHVTPTAEKPITGPLKPVRKITRFFKRQMTPENVVPAPQPKGALPARFAKYAGRFTKNLIADNKFWSRFNSIPNGLIIGIEALAAAATVAVGAPVALHAAGIAGCALLGGIGAYAVGAGFLMAWKSMEGICERSFPRFNPPRKLRQFLQRFVRKPVQSRLGQKLMSVARKINPKARKREVFLATVTLQGASAAAIYLGIHTARHIAALPALTAGNMLTAGMVWATYVATTCLFDVFSSVKTLFQMNKERKRDKRAKALKAAAASPVMKELESTLAAAEVTTTFNSEASPTQTKPAAAAQHAPAQAPKPRLS